MEKVMQSRIDVNKSPFDLSTFWGRVKHYAWVTDPRLTILSTKQLNESRDLLDKYRKGEEDPGTTENEVRKAQQQYLSAFHPDTGDLQNVVGRMSFQVPGGMVLIGAMITFYKSNTAVIFWQWANQSFNALVNYTNSNATSEINTKQLVTAYVSATSSALVVALGLKRYLHTRASPLMQRFVPFAAVAAANAVNIPLMRQNELLDGVTLTDEKGETVIKSKYAALKGISQVVTARICMATPSMTLLPVFMERLEKTRTFRRHTWLGGVCQVLFSGMISISSDKLNILDHKRVEELKQAGRMTLPATLYFNKGL